ncbi:MAG: hypothetical protein GY771_09410 [bacterium]|nr:hypothetical protein [bacterium]
MARKIIIAALLTLTGILMIVFTGCTGCGETVAVLISTNQVSVDDLSYHSVWWYDTVIMYDMLKTKYGYDHVYVLYGDGTDFNSAYDCYNSTTRFGENITDFPCDRAHIEDIFTALGTGGTVDGENIYQMTEDDRFFVWWMGHGYGTDSTDYEMDISHMGETVTGSEFQTWVNYVTDYDERSIHVMTCHAGCYLPLFDVAGNETVAEASSTASTSSYEIPGPVDVNHAEYTYHLYSALRGNEPSTTAGCLGTAVSSDTDSNGFVSLDESFTYVTGNTTTSSPQRVDPDSIAPTTYVGH